MTIEDAVKKFHWINIGEDGVVEMFLDHHSLATFRSCEASFELSMMAGIKASARSWNLEFGIIWHKLIEDFYTMKRDECFDFEALMRSAVLLWENKRMEEQFSEHKMYKVLGGLPGLIAMLGQYADHFAADVERHRVIVIEITFGKKREVPVGIV